MIFRWSIWGSHKSENQELLKYSILSFKNQFGENHKYVVFTDSPEDLSEEINNIAQVLNFDSAGDNEYNIKSKATWMKWCPTARIDINQTEFYIDSDVFLLKYPLEIERFLDNPELKFGIMDEYYGQMWQHGAMQRRSEKDTPFVNAGFFVQKSGSDISGDLSKEFNWWKQNIPEDQQTHHDEQGALAIALTKYLRSGELYIFPKDKYMLIGPNENKEIENLENITMFHAVYPSHPAFYKFRHFIDKVINK